MNSHDELELLSAYLDGELDAPDRARLDAHLTSCAECRTTLTGLQATIADLRTLPDPVPSPQDTWALRAAIRRARSPVRRWQRVAWAAGAVAAAAITFAAITLPGGGGARTFQATSAGPNGGVPLFESGENLTAADAQARLLSVAGVESKFVGTPAPAPAAPITGNQTGEGTGTQDSSVRSLSPASGEAAQLYSQRAESDSVRTQIDRCVEVVRRSTQEFLEPLQFVVATFENKPAFLLFFRTAERYELWVVGRSDCGVLFFSQAGA